MDVHIAIRARLALHPEIRIVFRDLLKSPNHARQKTFTTSLNDRIGGLEQEVQFEAEKPVVIWSTGLSYPVMSSSISILEATEIIILSRFT
jgi:hypothetical protein